MNEYHKIETLFVRDERTFKVKMGEWRLPEFRYLADNLWVATEKVDGTNIRVMWDAKTTRFGGKTDAANIPDFLVGRLMELFPNEKMASVFKDQADVCLYGEGYGSTRSKDGKIVRIQKVGDKYKSDGVDFVLFDVRIGRWWLQRDDVHEIAGKLGICVVPQVCTDSLMNIVHLAQVGFKSQWNSELEAEGLVLRPQIELFDRSGHRLIAKIKHKDF